MQAIFSKLVALLGRLLGAPGKVFGSGVADLRCIMQKPEAEPTSTVRYPTRFGFWITPFNVKYFVPMALASVVALSGCNASDSTYSPRLDEDIANEEWSVLHHDFGVVAPGTKLEHRFPIHNQSARRISIDKLVNTCSCTATVSSAKHINPGQVEYVTVNYLTGDGPADDRRKVVVLFAEPDVLPVALFVSANIRESLTAIPDNVSFSRFGTISSLVRTLEIQNFGDVSWDSIQCETDSDWITVESHPVKTRNGFEGVQPRQKWALSITLDPRSLPLGKCDAQVNVKAVGVNGLDKSISIRGEVVPPVTTSPSQLFFGTVPPGATVHRQIILHFIPSFKPQGAETVTFEHNLKNDLRLEWIRSEGAYYEIDAIFSPREDCDYSNALLSLSIATGEPDPIRLDVPIRALVENTK